MALTETIGIGKGSVHITDFVAADLIVVVGPEPGHQPPAHADRRSRRPSGRAPPIVAINPLPEAGLHPVQEPATAERAVRSGHRSSPTNTSRSGSTATSRSSRRSTTCSSPAASRPAARRRRSSTQYTSGFDRFADDARTFDWEHFTARHRFRPRDVAEAVRRATSVASERIIVCWAMGLTQHANSVATIREVVNFLLLRGNIGRPGAGRVPRARTLERAGRPDDGDLRAAHRRRSSTRSAAEFGFEPPRAHGLDTVDTIQRDARRRRVRSSSAWAATSRRRRPTPR